jgi:hypothetical protein
MSFFSIFSKKKDVSSSRILVNETEKESSSAIKTLCSSLGKEYHDSIALRGKLGIKHSDETAEQVKVFLDYNNSEAAKSYTDISNFIKSISSKNETLKNLISAKLSEKSSVNEYLALLTDDCNTECFQVQNPNESDSNVVDLTEKVDEIAESNNADEINLTLDSCKNLSFSNSENSSYFAFASEDAEMTRTTGDD